MVVYNKKETAVRGFTLIELSIVIVVIGLLAGGVLVGRDMIDAAKTRALMTNVESYRISINTFRDKYIALPGDMKNATQFWGKDNALCSADTGAVDADGTCNGDGNRTVSDADEAWHFWKHMQKSELINASITTYDYIAAGNMLVGVNVPESALSGASFKIVSQSVQSGATWWYDGSYGNVLRYGVPNNNGGCPKCFNGHSEMTPIRVLNIENKIDDGKPGTGSIRTSKPSTGSGVSSTSCTDNDDPTATSTANYRVNINTDVEAKCTTLFLLGS